jgi:hypothetical protein
MKQITLTFLYWHAAAITFAGRIIREAAGAEVISNYPRGSVRSVELGCRA